MLLLRMARDEVGCSVRFYHEMNNEKRKNEVVESGLSKHAGIGKQSSHPPRDTAAVSKPHFADSKAICSARKHAELGAPHSKDCAAG